MSLMKSRSSMERKRKGRKSRNEGRKVCKNIFFGEKKSVPAFSKICREQNSEGFRSKNLLGCVKTFQEKHLLKIILFSLKFDVVVNIHRNGKDVYKVCKRRTFDSRQLFESSNFPLKIQLNCEVNCLAQQQELKDEDRLKDIIRALKYQTKKECLLFRATVLQD